jgi:hypothetical protein
MKVYAYLYGLHSQLYTQKIVGISRYINLSTGVSYVYYRQHSIDTTALSSFFPSQTTIDYPNTYSHDMRPQSTLPAVTTAVLAIALSVTAAPAPQSITKRAPELSLTAQLKLADTYASDADSYSLNPASATTNCH